MAKGRDGIGVRMVEFFTAENLLTLVVLTALETVLGFDNLLYITIEAKRVAPERQKYVRQIGTALAIALRIALLFIVLQLIAAFQEPFASFKSLPVSATMNGHSLIVLAGGLFLIWTALKEIFHMLVVHDLGHGEEGPKRRTVAAALFWILAMNIVFSFDTVLSAVALTKNFAVMATAIVVSGILMVWLAEHVASFLRKNRMYEVLGLFVLLLVGVMLTSEGAHIMHLAIFNYPIQPIEKATFYFVVAALVVVDMIQSRYQKKIMAEEAPAMPQGGNSPSGHA
jgi:predicted tellurium resistance membrane protein TerC